MGTTPQVKVSLTPAMAVSLDVLAEKEGLAPASVARRLLHAQLRNTMQTQEVRDRLAQAGYNPNRWHRMGRIYTSRRGLEIAESISEEQTRE